MTGPRLGGALLLVLGCATEPTTVLVTIEAAPSVSVQTLGVRVALAGSDEGVEQALPPTGGVPVLPGTLLVQTPDVRTLVTVMLSGIREPAEPFDVRDSIETVPHGQVSLRMVIGEAATPDGGDAAQPNDLSVNDQAIAGPYNYMFVTSTTYTGGQIGGLAGGDAICQARANAAGLPGSYRAWLSSSTVSAKSRLGAANGWVRPDGLPFALSLEALTTGNQVLYPPRIDEFRNDLVASSSWAYTGSGPDGLALAGRTCADWTDSAATGGAVGHPVGGSFEWSPTNASASCNTPARLYCFGIDHAAPLTLTPTSGRLAFVTVAEYPIDPAGIAAFDQACAAEAGAAALLGSFRAFVATSSASAVSRFNLTGPSWVRTDGIPIVSQAVDLSGPTLLAPISVTAGGTTYVPVSNSARSWTGADNPAAAGTVAQTCSDWTVGGADRARAGRVGLSNSYYFRYFADWSCVSRAHLYCLQE